MYIYIHIIYIHVYAISHPLRHGATNFAVFFYSSLCNEVTTVGPPISLEATDLIGTVVLNIVLNHHMKWRNHGTDSAH